MTEKSPNLRTENETLDHGPSSEVALILDQYLEDIQNGRACSREELLEKHPELQENLTEYLDGIEMMAGLGAGNDTLPQQLGDFEILGQIGQGAMGTVFKARQLSLKRNVALKVLRYAVPNPDAHKRFEREAELVAMLRHSNIVPVFATGQQDGSHFLAMQLIDGPSLSTWSSDDEVDRDPVTIAKWGVQVARALAHAHQRDVIHRDIKPSNLLKENDHIWLTDFGLARRYDDIRMSMTGAMLGTPNYMSPEQAAPGRYPIDYRTDIYSLGATLFELLTGRCIFLAETPHSALAQILTDEPPPLKKVLPVASRDLETILSKCLEKEPSDRYQTADELADDLQAFAEGKSIKARRPSFPERLTRWRNQNKKAFTWAASTAATALTLLALSVAAWMGWDRASSGSIRFNSDEGPIVGRLVDTNGVASPSFSIPTEHDLKVRAGEYTLQMWTGGRLGECRKVNVTQRSKTSAEIKLTDPGVFPERTVDGFPAVFPLEGRDDLVLFSPRGVTRIDGRSGEKLWTAEASSFIEKVNQLTEEEQEIARTDRRKLEQHLLGQASWGVDFERIKFYGDLRIPEVVPARLDANGDGARDVLVSSARSSMLLALDGKNGELLWHYRSVPPVNGGELRIRYRKQSILNKPEPVGDIDGDGTVDFIGVFCAQRQEFRRWVDAISGKTGDRIWRKVLPTEWFDKSKYNVPDLALFSFGSHHRSLFDGSVTGSWLFRYGTTLRGQKSGDIKPWPILFAGEPQDSDCLLFAGDRLISIDRKTGEPGTLNNGTPVDLGFFPALPPKPIRDAGGQLIGILTCENVNYPGQSNKLPLTRFSMRDPGNGKEIWSFDSECDPAWLGHLPDWPLVADFVGDATPEILIVNNTDLQDRMHIDPSALSSLQLLDAKNGSPIWDEYSDVQIRSQDQQIQNLVAGPDANADGQADIYVVSPMVGSETWIYIDVLSGASGERIKTHSVEVPFFGNDLARALDFHTPLLIGKETSSDQRLVVSSSGITGDSKRQNTAIISLQTGELTQAGHQLEHPILADGDGDGHKDLFLIKPRSRDRLDLSGQLVSLKAVSGSGVSIDGDFLMPFSDSDGDGVLDLLNAKQIEGAPCKVLSGANGNVITEWSSGFDGRAFSLDSDHDGDGVNDFVSVSNGYQGYETFANISLISGRDGTKLWTAKFPTDQFGASPIFTGEDINGDGEDEFLMLHRVMGPSGTAKIQLSCLENQSGNFLWFKSIDQAGSISNRTHYYEQDFGFHIADVNNDGVKEIICPCFDSLANSESIAIEGERGRELWRIPSPNKEPNTDHRMPPWRCEVISNARDSEDLFVQVHPVLQRSSSPQVQLNFFNLSDGQEVSSIKIDGRVTDYSAYKEKRSPSDGFPFAVSDGQRQYIGICLEDATEFEPFIAIIDANLEQPRIVEMIKPEDLSQGNNRWRRHTPFLITDVNGDNKTDAVFASDDEMVTIELVGKTELSRRKVAYVTELARDDENGLIRVATKDGEDSRIKLLDPETLDVVWDLDYPRGMAVDSLLSSEAGNDGESAAGPRFLFRQNGNQNSVYCSIATAAEYKGDGAFPGSGNELNSSRSGRDLRMIEPLPWNEEYGVGSPREQFLTTVSEDVPVALGAIVFPIAFVWFLFRKKQWNLQSFMMLPLLFVVPWMALSLPSEFGSILASQGDMPGWVGKIYASMFTLPGLLFLWLTLSALWKMQWWMLLKLLLGALAITAVYAVVLLASDIPSLPAGGYYDIWDLDSLFLLTTGTWFMGVVVGSERLFSPMSRFAGKTKPPKREMA